MIRVLSVVLTLQALFFSSSAFSDSSQEMLVKGNKAWSAFQCSGLSEYAQMDEEAVRLYQFGVEQGREFLDAFVQGRITQEDLSSGMPWSVMSIVMGPRPSNDFLLGRLYEYAISKISDELFEAIEGAIGKEEKKSMGIKMYYERNCTIIGR